MESAARRAAYAAAGAEPGPDAPVGSAWLNLRPLRVVNDYDIICRIVYWIWLKAYLDTA